MRLVLIFILSIVLNYTSSAQNKELLQVVKYELPGIWTGQLEQGVGGFARSYTFELTIQLDGNQIKGQSYITVGKNKATMSFKGRLKGLSVEIEEIKMTDYFLEKDIFSWCIKNLHLEFGFENGRYRLKGPWDGQSREGQCSPGTIKVFKETIRA